MAPPGRSMRAATIRKGAQEEESPLNMAPNLAASVVARSRVVDRFVELPTCQHWKNFWVVGEDIAFEFFEDFPAPSQLECMEAGQGQEEVA